jgi:hypothetical protein
MSRHLESGRSIIATSRGRLRSVMSTITTPRTAPIRAYSRPSGAVYPHTSL